MVIRLEILIWLSICTGISQAQPIVSWERENYVFREMNDTDVTITLVLADPAPPGGVNVELVFTDGTATTGNDYLAPNTMVGFSEGEKTRSVGITIINDNDNEEDDQTFTAEIMNNPSITLGTPSVTTITILDDEATTESMPSGFNLTPEPESILISWSNDGCPSNFNPEEFFIRINEEPFIRVISTQSSYTVPDLTPFTNYTFVIILKCQDFLGSQVLNTEPSSPIEGATEQGRPSEVRNLTVETIGATFIQISWIEPEVTNGIITSHRIRVNGTEVNNTGAVTNFTITALEPLTTYEIGVIALSANPIGGNLASIIAMTTPAAPDNMPADLQIISQTQTSLEVNWTIPAGSGPIDSIFISWEPLGDLAGMPAFSGTMSINAADTSFNITGLEEFITYNISVRFVNIGGSGPPETIENTTQPTNPSAIPNEIRSNFVNATSIVVDWDAIPFKDQNGPNFMYQLTINGMNDTNTTDTSFTFTDLTPCTDYNISLTTLNDVGTYPGSISAVTDFQAPRLDTITILPASTNITITWSEDDCPFENVVIEHAAINLPDGVTLPMGSTTIPGNQSSFIITGLEEFVTFRITVLFVSSKRNSSNMTTTTTLPDVPAVAPATLFEHSSAFTNINVSWHKISFLDENGPDFTYIVFYIGNGVEMNTTTLNNFATITDLEECTNYSITVGTQNSQGVFSNRSSEIMFETQSVSVPGAVVLGLSSSTVDSISISWTLPTSDPCPIQYINIRWEAISCLVSGGMQRLSDITATTYNITGLEEYIDYQVYVTLENTVGNGSSSAMNYTTASTNVPDSVPMEIRLRMSRATELVVEWDPIPCYNQNGPGFVYVLNINGSENETAETNFIFTNLQPCSVYEISIITANMNGISVIVIMVASFTTLPTVPSAPSDLTLTPTDTTIQVDWTLPSDPCPADSITVMWIPAPSAYPGIADGMMVIGSTDTSYTIMGLEEYTSYEVSVLISNAAGTGPSTSDTTTTLPIKPSQVPATITVSSTTSSTIYVSWNAIDCISENGPNFSYIVYYSNNGNETNMTTTDISFNISDLVECTTYNISIGTQNDEGLNTDRSTPVLVETYPIAVQGLTVISESVTSTTIDITWTAPVGPCPSPDSSYYITYTPLLSGTSLQTMSATVNSSTTRYQITGLNPGVQYRISVAITTNEGVLGPASSQTAKTDESVPSVNPGIDDVTFTPDGGLMVTFKELQHPSETNGDVTYMVCYTPQGGAASEMVCRNSTSSPVIFPNVNPNSVYDVTVSAINGAGQTQSDIFTIDGTVDRLEVNDLILVITLSVIGSIVFLIIIITLAIYCYLLQRKKV